MNQALMEIAQRYNAANPMLRDSSGGVKVYNSYTGKYEVPPPGGFVNPGGRPWYLQQAGVGTVGNVGGSNQQGNGGGAQNTPTNNQQQIQPNEATTAPIQESASSGLGSVDYGGFNGGLLDMALGYGLGALGIGGGGNSLGTAMGGSDVSMGSAAGNAGDNSAEMGGDSGGSDLGLGGADVGAADIGSGGDMGGVGLFRKGGKVRHFASGGLADLADKYGGNPTDLPVIGVAESPADRVQGDLRMLNRELSRLPEGDKRRDILLGEQAKLQGVLAQSSAQPQPVQLGAVQGDAIPTEAPLPPASITLSQRGYSPELLGMLGNMPESRYAKDYEASRQREQVEKQAFDKLIEDTLSQKREKPSQAELYFRLAAAFGAPTKTGSFSESLANASGVMAEHAKAEREAAQGDKKEQLAARLKQRELGLTSARQESADIRALMQADQQTKMQFIKDWIASGKPQSEAGKLAMDQGLQPGTPQYQAFVNKYVEDKIASGNVFKEIALGIQQQNAGLAREKFAAEQESKKKLTPAEVKLKEETENKVNTYTGTVIPMFERISELMDKAFTGSLTDQAQFRAMKMAGFNDPRVVATEELNNLLSGKALESLKTTFGGNPTEGERAILLSIQGLDAASPESRRRIIMNAYKKTMSEMEAQRKRLDTINKGAYRETTKSED